MHFCERSGHGGIRSYNLSLRLHSYSGWSALCPVFRTADELCALAGLHYDEGPCGRTNPRVVPHGMLFCTRAEEASQRLVKLRTTRHYL